MPHAEDVYNKGREVDGRWMGGSRHTLVQRWVIQGNLTNRIARMFIRDERGLVQNIHIHPNTSNPGYLYMPTYGRHARIESRQRPRLTLGFSLIIVMDSQRPRKLGRRFQDTERQYRRKRARWKPLEFGVRVWPASLGC